VQHQAAGGGRFLVVLGNFRVSVCTKVGQQLVLVAKLDCDGGVLGDLARRLHQFLDKDIDIGGIVLQIVGGGEQTFVGGAEVIDRQHDELAGRFRLERAPIGRVDDRGF